MHMEGFAQDRYNMAVNRMLEKVCAIENNRYLKRTFELCKLYFDLHNIDNQLDATMTVLLTVSISSTCFGQLFTHLQER